MLYKISILAALLIFCACEDIRESAGVVADSKTLEPLDSVFVEFWEVKMEPKFLFESQLTDTSGSFGAGSLVGCSFGGCQDLILRFSRRGYDTLKLINPTDSIILLERR